jgi:septum formation protein
MARSVFVATKYSAWVYKQLMISPRLILASASPRRAQLLAQLGFDCEICPQDIDESRWAGESPASYVSRMAREKARSGSTQLLDLTGVLIAADTVVSLGDEVLAKPESPEQAEDFLLALANTTHEVRSAVCVIASDGNSPLAQIGEAVSLTRVTFSSVSRDEARRYWLTGEPQGKAGGYAIQGLAAAFIRSIEGSYSGVMGLPLFETAALLKKAGLDCLPPMEAWEQ